MEPVCFQPSQCVESKICACSEPSCEHTLEKQACLKPQNQDIECTFPRQYWSNDTEIFSLRSETYLRDKRKQPCCESMFQLIAMDLYEVEEHVEDVVKRLTGGVAQRYLEHGKTSGEPQPFLFIIHFQLPGEKKLAFIAYFTAKPSVLETDTPFARLFSDFVNGSDDFKQSRFKFIPSVSKGPYLVRSMVGSTPAILGNKLKQTYHQGEGYLEVCVDVGSSIVGAKLLKLVKGYISSLTFDMCFVLEAQSEQELPEVSLCTLRFSEVDLNLPAQKFVPSIQ